MARTMKRVACGGSGSAELATGRKDARDFRGGEIPLLRSTVTTSGVALTYGGVK